MIHLLLHGHRPVWRWVPISDYVDWRVCAICNPEPEPEPSPPTRPWDERLTNDYQVFGGRE